MWRSALKYPPAIAQKYCTVHSSHLICASAVLVVIAKNYTQGYITSQSDRLGEGQTIYTYESY